MNVEVISGKKAFVVTKHHFVLQAWAELRQTLPTAPILITLDHHTDTAPAFRAHLHRTRMHDPQVHGIDHFCRLMDQKLHRIDYHNPQSIVDAVLHLNHDEHIHAAIQAGILNHAYAISYSDFCGTPRRQFRHMSSEERAAAFFSLGDDDAPFDLPPDRIFHVPSECAVDCPATTHTDACYVEHSAQAIENDYLARKFVHIAEMSAVFGIANVLDHPFILDIDLDYFHSARSIEPKNPSLFYELIRRAIAVTIATEPDFVGYERLSGETITAELLLARLRQHIVAALAPPKNSAQASSA